VSNWFITFSGLFGATGVICGALGSHVLKARIPASELEIFTTAIIYLLVHSVVLLVCGVALNVNEANLWFKLAGILLVVGILLFCGGLIMRSVTGIPLLGRVAPVGGSALILGWVAIAVGGSVNFRHPK
jgi:uncharacterized membrane protein YgdD (TMEM256/DUF423 family)